MKSSLWCLILCVGLGAAALVAGRSATAEHPSVDAPAPAAPVCLSSEAPALGDDGGSMCGRCGDGYCNPRCGETATSCPRDCGVPS